MENLKTLLYSHGINLKKAYGQNFLTDQTLLEDIVNQSGIDKDTTVLEIGPGAGALTGELCKKAKKVIAYEIDQRLKPLLAQTVGGYSNLEIVFKDVMKEKLNVLEQKLGDNYLLVANLPYYITTPIVMNFLENSKKLNSLVIMVQKEVAQRFCAPPKTTDYGAITVAINLRGKAKIIKQVPREMFTPPPNVDSAVVKIDIDRKKLESVDLDKVREVVKIAFSSRRKMLVNNLMNAYKLARTDAETLLINSNVSLTARAEELTSEQYITLSENLKK
ncbi:MAG: ribosomal RNA small subunit methyltransferase A [Clostridia bacterium]|nr:ribosomal RNA small subunit methyltransferase A [Clostridia bacterium]